MFEAFSNNVQKALVQVYIPMYAAGKSPSRNSPMYAAGKSRSINNKRDPKKGNKRDPKKWNKRDPKNWSQSKSVFFFFFFVFSKEN